MASISRLAAAGLLAGVLSIAPVYAQQDTTTTNPTNPNTGTTTSTVTATNPGTSTVTTRYDDRGTGFDWGWLGLLGLFGLLGLRRPTTVAYRDRDRTYQDRTTTR
jgi:MYXO-CTERM domain-containing protein